MRQPHILSVQQVTDHFRIPPQAMPRLRDSSIPTWRKIDALDMLFREQFTNLPGGFRALAMFKVFEVQGMAIFKIASEFGRVLEKADCAVPVDYLPFNGKVICIEFPDDVAFNMKDGDFGRCAYVSCDQRAEGFSLPGILDPFTRRIDITVPLWRDDNKFCDGYVGEDNFRVFFKEGDTLETATQRSHENIGRPTGFTLEIIKYILKCVLYIHSGDPDLREFRPEPRPHNQKRLKRWRRENLCKIPLTLVGFDYKKPKEFSVGSTFVDTHLRWQPYGPQRSQVKLIWVRPHERHYKQVAPSLEVPLHAP